MNDFIVCLGYKGYVIKEYFANYFLHTADVTFDIAQQFDAGPSRPQRALERDFGRHWARTVRLVGG